jgi:hypothetical protein
MCHCIVALEPRSIEHSLGGFNQTVYCHCHQIYYGFIFLLYNDILTNAICTDMVYSQSNEDRRYR